MALKHVTSWSESYPLRNSLMGVRGFRQVFVQSFHHSVSWLLFSIDLLCSPWKGKARKCASSPHRRRHPWGVSSRERPRRLMDKSRSPVDEDFVDEGRPTFKLSRLPGTSKFVLHRNRAFLTLRQSKRSWRLDFWARKCLESNRHFDDRQSYVGVSSGVHTGMHDRVDSIS